MRNKTRAGTVSPGPRYSRLLVGSLAAYTGLTFSACMPFLPWVAS